MCTFEKFHSLYILEKPAYFTDLLFVIFLSLFWSGCNIRLRLRRDVIRHLDCGSRMSVIYSRAGDKHRWNLLQLIFCFRSCRTTPQICYSWGCGSLYFVYNNHPGYGYTDKERQHCHCGDSDECIRIQIPRQNFVCGALVTAWRSFKIKGKWYTCNSDWLTETQWHCRDLPEHPWWPKSNKQPKKTQTYCTVYKFTLRPVWVVGKSTSVSQWDENQQIFLTRPWSRKEF